MRDNARINAGAIRVSQLLTGRTIQFRVERWDNSNGAMLDNKRAINLYRDQSKQRLFPDAIRCL